ncbi:hypothetical protein ACFYSF_36710 [Streptomyces canus]|uniref:hypothetical protein n=1 Tax=Streptomyces canus TaxID=58343 RepID=UPI0036ACFA14
MSNSAMVAVSSAHTRSPPVSTALRAKREGSLAAIDGVYALVPYISGLYGTSAKTREAALPSLVENDGYFMGCGTAAIMAEVYDPGAEHATDPALLALSRDRRGPLRAAAARPLCHP